MESTTSTSSLQPLPSNMPQSTLVMIRHATNLEFTTSPHPHFYLLVPHGLPLRLTPPFSSDEPLQVEALNDRNVGFILRTPPYPYRITDAVSYNSYRSKIANRVFGKMISHIDEDSMREVEGCPVSCIRNGETGEWMGDLGCRRWGFEEIEFMEGRGEERRVKIEENTKRPLGDPGIIWTFGCESCRSSTCSPRDLNILIKPSALSS